MHTKKERLKPVECAIVFCDKITLVAFEWSVRCNIMMGTRILATTKGDAIDYDKRIKLLLNFMLYKFLIFLMGKTWRNF
jgi:large-conductance mechanosensitive channel